MAEYYKYVARDADSQINYAELGQQAVGELQNWYNTREEKKEAYKQAARESVNNLMDAPQGKDQNANDFISKYAQKMIDQKMVDKNLFERGLINEKDYTLRMQNQMDGTKRLFNLQKLYQQEFETTMQGINDKKLQRSFTISNQSDVEGAANFNNSEAFINPDDGSVSVGLMENKVIDGKIVRVLNPNTTATTAVWSGKILQKPAYFDVNSKTTDFVKNLGDLKTAMYSAASTARAGTITELTGAEFLKTNIKDPATKAIVENFNDAVNLEVDSYFAGNTLNVASILGDETGKYNFKSFTFDRELADKDPTKILKMIDPVTQMPILDETGKHYQAQLAEAKAFVKTQILGKLDNEKKISATSQMQAQYAPEYISRKKDEDKAADNATNMLGKLWYGDNNQAGSAVDFFKGFKNDKGEVLFKDIIRDKTGITVVLANGTSEKISFLDKDNKPRTQEDFIASAGPLLAGQFDVSKSLQRGAYSKNAKFNSGSTARATTVERFKTTPDIVSLASQDAVSSIESSLPSGFTAEDTGDSFAFSEGARNQVTVTGPTGKKYIVKTKKSGDDALNIIIGLEDFVNKEISAAKPQSGGTVKFDANGNIIKP